MSDDLLVRLTLVADALNDAGNFDGEGCVLEAVEMIGEMRVSICEVLTGLALADHLGDVRNNEGDLYRALGVDIDGFERERFAYEDVQPIVLLAAVAERFNLPVPDHVLSDD